MIVAFWRAIVCYNKHIVHCGGAARISRKFILKLNITLNNLGRKFCKMVIWRQASNVIKLSSLHTDRPVRRYFLLSFIFGVCLCVLIAKNNPEHCFWQRYAILAGYVKGHTDMDNIVGRNGRCDRRQTRGIGSVDPERRLD